MNKFKINSKAIILTAIASFSLTFSACNDWLNVQPSNQKSAEEQFSKEEGFKVALTGVYTLMSQTEMYGREMTFATVDFLGQYWGTVNAYSPYTYLMQSDYENSSTKQLVDPIFKKSYNAIANINDLLAFIDVNRKVFTTEMSYATIKGEALALRAYLHFDMLRLFAPNNFDEPENMERWLPYVDEYSRDTKESLTNTAFAERVIKDLEAAMLLLKQDPIYTGIASTDTYFINRHFHMNYYAACAEMARVYLYTGNKTKAKEYAQEVYDAQNERGLFSWVTVNDVLVEDPKYSDRTFSSEHIFALNVNRMGDNIKTYFTEVSDNNNLYFYLGEQMFEFAEDYRAKYHEKNSDEKYISSKFAQPKEAIKKLKRMPLIRISEIYYILAECTGDLRYINAVRANRGVDVELIGTDVQAAITNEVRQEFIGEGQRFYYHKRLNSKTIESSRPAPLYTLVMPENEIDLGGRPRPSK